MFVSTFVGTTEAASLLNICCQRVRQLLAAGRVEGAKKEDRTWKIPLFNGMPKIIPGSRGPKGTWRKKLQAAVTYIHVIRQRVVGNQTNNEKNEGVITVKRGSRKPEYCHEVEINGPCRLVYRPDHPLNSGARLWIEVEPF